MSHLKIQFVPSVHLAHKRLISLALLSYLKLFCRPRNALRRHCIYLFDHLISVSWDSVPKDALDSARLLVYPLYDSVYGLQHDYMTLSVRCFTGNLMPTTGNSFFLQKLKLARTENLSIRSRAEQYFL